MSKLDRVEKKMVVRYHLYVIYRFCVVTEHCQRAMYEAFVASKTEIFHA